MKWDELVKLGRELPEVEVGPWYGTPSLKVRGKGFVRLKEDGETVVFVLDAVEEQEVLCDANPEVYFVTDHYRGYAMVLARLKKLKVKDARFRLLRAWKNRAPKSLLRKHEANP